MDLKLIFFFIACSLELVFHKRKSHRLLFNETDETYPFDPPWAANIIYVHCHCDICLHDNVCHHGDLCFDGVA